MNISFESLRRETPAAAPSQLSRGVAAGSQFNSLLSAGISPAAANPPPSDAAAGAHYPSALSNPAYAFLKRSQFAQALIDVIALIFLLLFVSFAALVIGGAPFVILIIWLLS